MGEPIIEKKTLFEKFKEYFKRPDSVELEEALNNALLKFDKVINPTDVRNMFVNCENLKVFPNTNDVYNMCRK